LRRVEHTHAKHSLPAFPPHVRDNVRPVFAHQLRASPPFRDP
jgi:hypothetical protein